MNSEANRTPKEHDNVPSKTELVSDGCSHRHWKCPAMQWPESVSSDELLISLIPALSDAQPPQRWSGERLSGDQDSDTCWL